MSAALLSLDDTGAGFDGGGFDESAFDSTISDFNPTTGDLGQLPDPNTTIPTGAVDVISMPADFGNDPGFTGTGNFPGAPADNSPLGPGYDQSPPEPLGGITGLEPVTGSLLEGTPADVPGGTLTAGTLPGTSTGQDSTIGGIISTAGDILGGLFGVANAVLNGASGGNKGIGGSGTPTGTTTGSPSAPANSKAPQASTVGMIDVTNNDTIGLYLVVGLLVFVLWKK